MNCNDRIIVLMLERGDLFMEPSKLFLMSGITNIPKEFDDFFYNTFHLMEIRGCVGKENGITFEIRSKESNHNIPHLHASYGEYNISIALDNQEILAGNLPIKKQKFAQNWVRANKEKLLGKWNKIRISTYSTTTISRLEQ